MKHLNVKNITEEETLGVGGELVTPEEMSDEEKKRIKGKIISSLPCEKAVTTSLKRRMLSVIAASFCIFALLACAAEAFGWDIRISNLLNATQEDMKYADQTGLASQYERIQSNQMNGDVYQRQGNMFEENLEKEKIYLINKIKNMSEKELRLFSDFLKYVYRTDDKFKKIESDRDN